MLNDVATKLIFCYFSDDANRFIVLYDISSNID